MERISKTRTHEPIHEKTKKTLGKPISTLQYKILWLRRIWRLIQRPHLHLIIFNLPIKPENIVPKENTKDGNTLYYCPEIEKVWGQGKVVLAHVNWSTCAYVARYVTKKEQVK